jgi:hypothetical protein
MLLFRFLQLDPEAVGDAIDECKVCHQQGEVEDGAITPALRAQARNIRCRAS